MKIENLLPVGQEVNVSFGSPIPKITLEGLEANFVVDGYDMEDSVVLRGKEGDRDQIELYCYNVEYVLPEDRGTDRKNIYAVRR